MLAGIDLGGTQVRVALARSDGRLVASIKTKTSLLGTPQGLVDWASSEIDRHRGREKVRSITIAAPGPIDVKRGVLVNPPNLPWQNVPLAAMLGRATGAKGQLGCLEAFVSGTALARETGHPASELFAEAARGDRHARMVVERAARYMGIALISLTNVIDPEMFVIGGGVSRSWALVQPTMLETLRSSPFIKPARRPSVRRARLGDRAGQVGAVEWARINQ